MYSKSNVNGAIIYDNNVIQSVAGIAATSCYGVVEMASIQRIKDFILNTKSSQYFNQGISVNVDEYGVIDLDVHVVLGYSIPVGSVCREIKKRVAYDIEKNLNIKVRNIVVFVEAIDNIG